MVMAAAGQAGGQVPDLYQLLGVPRGASGEEITRAWRRRAAAEHPDHRPRDDAAPARFRAVTEAYQVLSDPARRAAYDRSSGNQPGPAATVPERLAAGAGTGRPRGISVPVVVRRGGRPPEPPLRVGPVWADVPAAPPAAPAAAAWPAAPRAAGARAAEDDLMRLAALAGLVRYLADDRGWPW
jgi:curved DNA-binding protein CbpA